MKGARGWFEDDSESEPELPVFYTVCGKAKVEKLLDPADVKQFEFTCRCKNEICRREWDPGGPQPSLFVLCVAVVEICGGKGGITQRCIARGLSCGPIINIQRCCDLLEERLFEWLLRLALAGRVWGYALEPRCTSFSQARKPGVRDMDYPEGYWLDDECTLLGTFLGMMHIVLALAHAILGDEYLFEQPGCGHM